MTSAADRAGAAAEEEASAGSGGRVSMADHEGETAKAAEALASLAATVRQLGGRLPECADWGDVDFDDSWVGAIEQALAGRG